jgi:hypothetical protein
MDSGRSDLLHHKLKYGAKLQDDGSWLHDDGDVYYYNAEGEVHRIDGPAIIEKPIPFTVKVHNIDSRFSGFYIEGEPFSFDEWLDVVDVKDEKKMLLRLQYG